MTGVAARVPETMDKKRTPEVHPKPYESPLWQHLDTIRALRRQRKTWAAIAAHLEETHGLKTTLRTVRNFFKRARAGRVPLGFDESETPARAIVLTDAPDTENDRFSVEVSPEDPFAKTRRRYAKEYCRDDQASRTKR
jgi:hypothetical protein